MLLEKEKKKTIKKLAMEDIIWKSEEIHLRSILYQLNWIA
jgi:hypothetical protein